MRDRVVIIGCGASGMACAIFLAEQGIPVTVLERNDRPGKKLYLTGKGRCNLTNVCAPEEFLEHVVSNPKFLYSAIYGFTSDDAVDFFERIGLRVKVERGRRAFPVSDHSSDVIRALTNAMNRLGVEVIYETKAAALSVTDGKADRVITEKGLRLEAGDVILATGGLSYPSTGSDGSGYVFAGQLGVEVTKTRPSLVSLRTSDDFTGKLAGLTLRNITFSVYDGRKLLFREFGELLFTHTGVSGPVALRASAYVVRFLDGNPAPRPLRAAIDLKPALSEEQLDQRILREFDSGRNRHFKNAVASLFPSKLRDVIIGLSEIDPDRPVNEITKNEREGFVRLIRHFPLTICGHGGYEEAVITQGGIKTGEVDPSTMRLKKYQNIYAIGEVLDVDALTGGYNLQIAWATAKRAAEAIGGKVRK